MTAADVVRLNPKPRKQQVLPNPVLAICVFIMTEVMFFAGFLSAFAIAKASIPIWPPLGQPRLPVEATAFNTAALLVSGVLMFLAGRSFKTDKSRAKKLFLASAALGVFFVLFQGAEWVALIREGLTLQTSTHAGFFYMLVGAHGLHAIAGLTVLGVLFQRFRADSLDKDVFWAGRIFWYFVVGLWPVLYWQVYL